MEKIFEVDKKIIKKLENVYGVQNCKNQILDYIKNIKINKEERQLNLNIIISNNSSYLNQTKDKLIDFIYKILIEYKVIKPGIQNISQKEIDKYLKHKTDEGKAEVIGNDLIIIDSTVNFRNVDDYMEEISNLMKKYHDKIFIIVEECNKFTDNSFKAGMCDYVDWFFEIDKISKDDKKEYIMKELDKQKIDVSMENINELSEESFYKLKNIVSRIIFNCQNEKKKIVTDNDMKKYLEKEVEKNYNVKRNMNLRGLSDLVGLDVTKEEITKIINYLKLCKKRQTDIPMLHMCFTGNPGTGKTTVARIVGDILSKEGILSTGNFVEIHARDLVGKYVGWTAKTVKKKIEEAKGGVLFIDEVYSLNSDNKGSFEDEAIATLIKEMEDNRDDICIILAGYEEETMELISRNPGFESRVQFYMNFEDYENEELYKIFESLSQNEQYMLSSNVKEYLYCIFDKEKKEENFSNARFVRNLFEKTKIEQANRVSNNEGIDNINKIDVQNAIKQTEYKKNRLENKCKHKIGFIV